MTGLSKRRLADEAAALQAKFPEVQALEGAQPIFEVSLDIDGEARHVRLTLPPGYPSVPPEVRELERPGGRTIMPVGAMYRFPDGVACLFTHGNDAQVWRRDRRAVEAVERFIALVRLERESSASPRCFHYEDEVMVVIPPEIAAVMLVPAGRGRLRLRGAGTGRGALYADALQFDSHQGLDFDQAVNERWRAVLPRELWVPWFNLQFDGRAWRRSLSTTFGHAVMEFQSEISGEFTSRGGLI